MTIALHKPTEEVRRMFDKEIYDKEYQPKLHKFKKKTE